MNKSKCYDDSVVRLCLINKLCTLKELNELYELLENNNNNENTEEKQRLIVSIIYSYCFLLHNYNLKLVILKRFNLTEIAEYLNEVLNILDRENEK